MRRRLVVLALATVAVAVAALGVTVVRERHSPSPTLPLAKGKVSLIGDSLNLGVEPYLTDVLSGWTVETDDVVGRSTELGIEHLRADAGSLGRYVVISLGTNDPVSAVDAFGAAVTGVLTLAGTRCVVWATIHRDGDAYEPFNTVLRRAAATNRNLRLVEWTSMISAHPDWLAADHIHATSDGYRARADAIVAAMRSCPRRA